MTVRGPDRRGFFTGESGLVLYQADSPDRAAELGSAGALAGARRTDLVRVNGLAGHRRYSLFLFN